MVIRSRHIRLFINKKEESVNDASAGKADYVLGLSLQLKHNINKEQIHLIAN